MIMNYAKPNMPLYLCQLRAQTHYPHQHQVSENETQAVRYRTIFHKMPSPKRDNGYIYATFNNIQMLCCNHGY